MDELNLAIAARELAVKSCDELLAKLKTGFNQADFDAANKKQSEIEELDVKIKNLQAVEELARKNAAKQAELNAVDPTHRPGTVTLEKSEAAENDNISHILVPSYCKARTPKNLIKVCGGNREEAQKVAYAFGQFAKTILNPKGAYGAKAAEWCQKNGIVITLAQAENSNSAGGVLVPIQLANYVIELMEKFGIFRQYASVKPMSGDTLNVARRTGTITGYWLVDNAAIQASSKTWDLVGLVAKKLAALIYFSNEISEDATINLGDDLANELAFNFSFMEDNAGFNGTGTSTYGTIIGLAGAFATAFPTGGPGIIVQSTTGQGGAFSSFTLADFNNAQGALPDFVWQKGTPSWYCSRQFYYASMVKVAAAAGGNRIDTIEDGPLKPIFLGCPVVFTQVMPSKGAVSQNVTYFGDLSMSSSLGDRKMLSVALSDQIGFANDQLAIRGITRVDISNHDVGGNGPNTLAQNPTYDQTGGTYYAGPIVALQSAAS